MDFETFCLVHIRGVAESVNGDFDSSCFVVPVSLLFSQHRNARVGAEYGQVDLL